MNSSILKKRQVEPLVSFPGILRGYELSFDTPGNKSGTEPTFANIRKRKNVELHGVIHKLCEKDIQKIDAEESKIGYVRICERVLDYSGKDYFAEVYICLNREDGKDPSRRYLNILIQGAHEHKLKEKYIRALEKV